MEYESIWYGAEYDSLEGKIIGHLVMEH